MCNEMGGRQRERAQGQTTNGGHGLDEGDVYVCVRAYMRASERGIRGLRMSEGDWASGWLGRLSGERRSRRVCLQRRNIVLQRCVSSERPFADLQKRWTSCVDSWRLGQVPGPPARSAKTAFAGISLWSGSC